MAHEGPGLVAALEAENGVLREEIRAAREAAEISARQVVEQLEKTEVLMSRMQAVKDSIHETNEEMAAIFESSTFGIAFIRNRAMIRANNKLEELLGYEPGELHGQPTRCWYQDEEAYRLVGEAYGDLAQGNTHRRVMQLQRKDGSLFWCRLSGRGLSDDLSRGSVWTVEDISIEHDATEALLRAKDEMTAIFESSTIGIAFVKDRVTLKANGKLEELFGYEPGELVGQTTRCWYPDEAAFRAAGDAYRALQQGKTGRLVIKLQRKDGSLFWAKLSGSAITADLSNGTVWTVEDITAEHDATEAMLQAKEAAESAEGKLRENYVELKEANQRLQKLDQLKSDFLSSVSHELRTPLTSIRGFSQLIEREFVRSFVPLAGENAGLEKKSARIQENLKIILKESERLTRLINDVLDLAKIEAGRTEWRDAPIRVADFIQDVVNTTHGMFEHKPEIELRLDIQPDLPTLIGDADHLLQVLANLINNAVKFTDSGAVTILAFANTEGLIQIEVRDTGIGFPPEDAEAIFDKFQQAKQGDTLQDRPKGTGLGLAICREIVSRHGGRVWAQSGPGQGSTFALTLPAASDSPLKTATSAARIEARSAASAAAPVSRQDRPRVLVVDDDPGVRDYFSQLLQEQDFEVATAMDGQAALSEAKGFAPDLITMDLDMPVMDGRTAIQLLRADPALRHIPIMVISAIPGFDSAGGDVAMGKPPDEALFVENIRALLNQPSVGREQTLRFLVLYEDGREPSGAPAAYAARCEVDFCPVGELTARIRAGFKGMVAIPADLLKRVDIGSLNAEPSLQLMIIPAATDGSPNEKREA
ncbi:MAG TPA: PAS domain S-box protein [Rhodocyclaceae bacterium]|nr:PAS domain S-box protein [Rhodocyclaceae bacterium]